MRGVEVFLQLLRASRLRLQRIQLATGHGELGLRAFEFRPEPDRFLLDLAGLAIDLRVDRVALSPFDFACSAIWRASLSRSVLMAFS